MNAGQRIVLTVMSAVIGWMSLGAVDGNAGHAGSRRFFFEKEKQVVWDIPVQEKVVALTFDDGPGKITPDILRLFAHYHDRATFFVTGVSVDAHPKMLRAEAEAGHEIGNHTDRHRDVKSLNSQQLAEEVQHCTEKIEEVAHVHPRLFRTPAGYYDDRVVNTVNHMGYRMILWSWDEDSRDWNSSRPDVIARRVLKGLHRGDIVIFHDGGGNRRQTLRALQILLPKLHEMGYRSVTVTDLIHMKNHRA